MHFSQVDLREKASILKTLYYLAQRKIGKLREGYEESRERNAPISANRENVIIGRERGASERILLLLRGEVLIAPSEAESTP